jgi:hypothetical protein
LIATFHFTFISIVIGPPVVTASRLRSMYPPAFDVEDVVPVPTITTPLTVRVGSAPTTALLLELPCISVATLPPTESVIVVPLPPRKSQ